MLQNEEAFEDGINEDFYKTEDVVKHGVEKLGVYIHAHAENAVKTGNIEEDENDNF